MKGIALQVKDGKEESVYGCYLVLSPTPSVWHAIARHTVYAAIAHLTVHDLLYLAGCTVFA